MVGSIHLPIKHTDSGAAPKDGEVKGRLSSGESIIVIGMLVLGSAMQAYANNAIEAVLVALFLLLAGMVVVALVFSNRKPEMRAFLLTFTVCIFVGGLAQVYSLAAFNKVQSTIDARGFLAQISANPPFATFSSASFYGSPLAIVIWQQFYKLTWLLGFKFGPYTGVMVNSLVMGLIAGLTVQIARELFGNDLWRLRRVGTLVAANGLFILFGSILLRDCFTTLFMTLVLLGGIRFLVRPSLGSLLIASAIIAVSAWAMQYLREDAFLLIVLYAILIFLFWLLGRLKIIGVTVAAILLIVIIIGSSILSVYFQNVQLVQNLYLEKYTRWASITESTDSLGLQFLYNQPLPVRLIVGSASLLISPIPLWAHFRADALDYHWIKGYNGIYQLIVMPLVFAGYFIVFRLFLKARKQSWPYIFLILFLLINLIGVVASSLEQRHFGQFMSAFVIIAAIPDTREKKTVNVLRGIKFFWYFGVLLVHIAWAILKII